MDIEYLHLYVQDAAVWRDWFVNTLNFRPLPKNTFGELSELAVCSARIVVLISSPQTGHSDVRKFLQNYSEGVGDIAFRVNDLAAIADRVQQAGGVLTHPIQEQASVNGKVRWCRLPGWGSASHTLIETPGNRPERSTAKSNLSWLSIDHAVLNVPSGQLEQAAVWYETYLGFTRQQKFVIETPRSGLRSIVLKHPHGTATMPINEPTSPNSQIQEFLDLHGGAGIQHVALQTDDLVYTIALLRDRGVPFLSVPLTYYQQLRERAGFWQEAGDWEAIAQQQILVDWPTEDPLTRLLQTFTLPLFEKPTFFWEFIERQPRLTETGLKCADGFGEGNFQALFEAIEREQQQRGSLK